jgi:hypothetical protein
MGQVYSPSLREWNAEWPLFRKGSLSSALGQRQHRRLDVFRQLRPGRDDAGQGRVGRDLFV